TAKREEPFSGRSGARPLERNGFSGTLHHANREAASEETPGNAPASHLNREYREKDSLLKAIWDLSPDLLAIKDTGCVYRMANRAFCEWVQVSEREIAGKTDADLFPDDWEAFRQADMEAIRTGRPVFREETRRTPRGVFHFHVSRVPYGQEDGEPLGLFCALRNITELKELISRAQKALGSARRHAQALQQLIDSMPAGVVLLDSDLRLVAWNKVYLTYFDPSIEWRAGRRIEEVMPLAEEAGIVSRLRRALRTGRPIGVRDFRYDGLKRGTTYWHGAAVPVQLELEGGAGAALALVLVDVTPEVTAREKYSQIAALAEERAAELEAERTRLKTIIDSMPIALIVCDAGLNVIASNSVTRHYAAALGLGRRSLKNLMADLPAGIELLDQNGVPVDRRSDVITRSLLRRTHRDRVITCRSPGGPTMTLSINTALLRDARGKTCGVIIAASDITAHERAKEEIREIYRREHAVAEKLQASFMLDQCPPTPGFELAHTYHAALDEALVGGDFYDVFPLSEGKLALVIADVAGKGLNAAVYTAMTKYMLRAYALERPAPDLVLTRLNEALAACTPTELFVTLIYGILDCTTAT
ncbi:MAG: PAS domain-containing protein, partial [Armatimonadota bacterium]